VQLELQCPLLLHRKHMSAGLGIRRPIKAKQSGTKQETKLQFITYFASVVLHVMSVLSRLLIFIVSCKFAICINDYMLRSHPKENSISIITNSKKEDSENAISNAI
jgi:hypothetical protein